MRTAIVVATVLGVMATVTSPAWAQKNSGPLLPDSPAARPTYAAPPSTYQPPRAPAPAIASPAAASPGGADPDAQRMARTLPLDPQTRELQNQMPADPHATESRLGLREPHGPATDMRGRTPSPREIVNALAPR